MSDGFVCDIATRGELAVEYFAHIEKVCLEIRASYSGLNMQMTREQAIEMRDKLTAAIEMATRATCEPCDGRGLIRFDDGGLSRCEDCEGEGVVRDEH